MTAFPTGWFWTTFNPARVWRFTGTCIWISWKDIIKIDSPMELDLDVLGYIDADITVNIIRDGRLKEKKHLELPHRLVNVIRCRNPRCITAAEPQLDAIFLLGDTGIYRCAYCEAEEHRGV